MRYILFSLIFVFSLNLSGQGELRTLNKDLPCVNKKFQVYAHVILDTLGVANLSPSALESDLANANNAFAEICISFELCGIDTIMNYEFDSTSTSQEEEEIVKLFHVKNRINFYLLTTIEKDGAPVCGFAAGSVASMNNGIIFLAGACVTHELGHLFGLPHTFENPGSELVDGSNCETAGDGICDTPADPYTGDPDIIWQGGPSGCEFIYEGLDSLGQYYQPDVGNIMSYYSCTCGFTRQQYIKMANTYLNSNFKMW